MNLYFSCSLTGGRDDESVYAAIVDHLLSHGHEVPTAHLARSDVMAEERVIAPREVFLRDTAWIRTCDAVIAEVSTPSHGVGYEIAFALGLGKPVLCCYREGVSISKMITGNSAPQLAVQAYQDRGQVLQLVDEFLASLRLLSGG